MDPSNILLSADLQALVDQRVAAGHYTSREDYIGHLIRSDTERSSPHQLESLLVERIESDDFVECDEDDFRSMRASFVAGFPDQDAK